VDVVYGSWAGPEMYLQLKSFAPVQEGLIDLRTRWLTASSLILAILWSWSVSIRRK